METQPREIQLYLTTNGQEPFTEWFEALQDVKTQTIIDKRLDRVRLGNLGDVRSLGSGVFELRIDHGSGYRVYFGEVGTTIVLLLLGGDKRTQAKDILKAKEYWKDYEHRQSTRQ
jgi:putative addiction module killer protein